MEFSSGIRRYKYKKAHHYAVIFLLNEDHNLIMNQTIESKIELKLNGIMNVNHSHYCKLM
ncbi:hypothetical protein CU478_14125 [Acinetobacter pseudolwoffii]|nr:hypothetical protein CU478_14125 [Acinetobacter pseudolwoffii]PJI33147.1 hypothetical protein CU318_14325 [Acinetobacter pseudolwoffii]